MNKQPERPNAELVQHYLKSLYALQGHAEHVTTAALADELNLARSDVEAVIEQLVASDLVGREPEGVLLTPTGTQRVSRIITLFESESAQNFLKAIYTLQQNMERVSTNALAEALTISAPSVTDMAQRLQEAGFVHYRKYRGVVLTPTGEKLALSIIRRHRLIELYLVEELGYGLHEVHDEAENLEHAVSERFIEAIADKLDDPHLDPHGDPIPSADGTITRRQLKPLTEWPLHTAGRIARIDSSQQDMFAHILERGFRLGAAVVVLSRDPFQGPVTVRVDDVQQVIGHRVAASILIEDEA